MKKILIKILIILAVIIAVLLIAKNPLAKGAAEGIVKKVTGLELKMRSLNIGLRNTLIDIKGLRLFNPKGFEDKVMVDVPEIFVNYDLSAILGGEIHLEEMRLNLSELVVVKNAGGEINLNYLKPASSKETPATKAEPQAEPSRKKDTPDIKIDQFRLQIGKVTYKDYTREPRPYVQEFKIDLDETHENINNPSALVGLIVAKALMKTTVANLAGFDMDNLMSNFDFAGVNMEELGLSKFEGLATEAQGFKEKAAAAVEGFKKFIHEKTAP